MSRYEAKVWKQKVEKSSPCPVPASFRAADFEAFNANE
jgi:hypothetical protein